MDSKESSNSSFKVTAPASSSTSKTKRKSRSSKNSDNSQQRSSSKELFQEFFKRSNSNERVNIFSLQSSSSKDRDDNGVFQYFSIVSSNSIGSSLPSSTQSRESLELISGNYGSMVAPLSMKSWSKVKLNIVDDDDDNSEDSCSKRISKLLDEEDLDDEDYEELSRRKSSVFQLSNRVHKIISMSSSDDCSKTPRTTLIGK
jgi:hypothetical protein